MIRHIFAAELLQQRRDGRLKLLMGVTILLCVVAALSGYDTITHAQHESREARIQDREIWDTQGEKNPHTAAHFSRYVFRPNPNLALFDPGLQDYVGRATWVEAHYRDPAALRAIEDMGALQRIAAFSPAWILQVLAPLISIIVAANAIATERERGTLRQLMSSGITPMQLFIGKGLAVGCVALTLLPALGLAFLLVLNAGETTTLPETPLRLGLLGLVYGLYILSFSAASLGLSARVKKAKTALILVAGFWAVSVLFTPRLATDITAMIAPSPEPSAFASQLHSKSSDPFWGSSDEALKRREKIEREVLERYGVENASDLPINLDGYMLQASEEYANVVFDEMYAKLWGSYGEQQAITRLFAVISPRIALANISRALAGTGLDAQRHYSEAAEVFRRDFIKRLNEDMINNGGADGYDYVTNNAFWSSLEDFRYEPANFRAVLAAIVPDLLVLFVWFAVALWFALNGFKYSFRQEAAA